MADVGFAAKLALILKALAISRGRLAADVGVDKSLVGRWCSGTVSPSAHNMARLTQVIATRLASFTMHDWDLDLAGLAARFGVSVAATESGLRVPSGFAEWLALPKFREAALASGSAARAIHGFWRTTRPVPELPGEFVHDYVILQATTDGPLSFRMGIFSNRMVGWAVAVGDQMYCCCSNSMTGATVFAIFNRVQRPRVEVMDGVSIACMADAGGVPVAAGCLLERVGDLSGDAVADEARYEALLAEHPVAPPGSVPEPVRARLWPDTGPGALAAGGDAMIMMRSLTSLARGSAPGVAAAGVQLRVVG